MDWILMMSKTANARIRDVALFNRWERGEISTGQCIKWFKKNNKMPERIIIGEAEFTVWLRSLGYIREVL